VNSGMQSDQLITRYMIHTPSYDPSSLVSFAYEISAPSARRADIGSDSVHAPGTRGSRRSARDKAAWASSM
jgi:hypothetical protein